jgi:hypothetical protein
MLAVEPVEFDTTERLTAVSMNGIVVFAGIKNPFVGEASAPLKSEYFSAIYTGCAPVFETANAKPPRATVCAVALRAKGIFFFIAGGKVD